MRIVINKEGEAVTMKRAREMGILPLIVFIRNDGWMLGAPLEFEKVAYEM